MPKIDPYSLIVYPLSKKHDVSFFNSTEEELNDFFKNDAKNNQEQLVSRTYVCYYEKHLVGYFTLTTDVLEVKAIKREDMCDDFAHDPYPAVKLARLAVDQNYERMGVGQLSWIASCKK
ncbi:hypothetical protein EFE42_08520 [Methanohalophilus sp. RSK]|uniref:hypothetical protein n=1 Tax=Methanohalophilus sp. RSK TaxID=2485783 RepID=UPI000F43A93C|nr:hypothetical protein [Methanohalophilus sp. RSK]RNI12444.1 hypothetical protein EFE42_08520 [Methanohalophilus sp. RSK]